MGPQGCVSACGVVACEAKHSVIGLKKHPESREAQFGPMDPWTRGPMDLRLAAPIDPRGQLLYSRLVLVAARRPYLAVDRRKADGMAVDQHEDACGPRAAKRPYRAIQHIG